MIRTFSLFVLVVFAISVNAQTVNFPRASPTCKVDQEFGTSKIMIEYSRPGVKGRDIFGGLVPYDSVWRTGANSATKIYFGDEVQIEGNKVPAGKYALYTIPGKQSWTIVLSTDTALWGSFGYSSKSDFLRVKVKPTTLSSPVETFMINVANIKNDACDVELAWDKTKVSFHVTTNTDARVMAQIDEAMKGDKPPYWQAAYYYFENGHDVNKAYEWVNKAIVARPDAYYMLTEKAKMELAMGKYKEALETATAARDMAIKSDDTGHIFTNNQTIATAKAKMK